MRNQSEESVLEKIHRLQEPMGMTQARWEEIKKENQMKEDVEKRNAKPLTATQLKVEVNKERWDKVKGTKIPRIEGIDQYSVRYEVIGFENDLKKLKSGHGENMVLTLRRVIDHE